MASLVLSSCFYLIKLFFIWINDIDGTKNNKYCHFKRVAVQMCAASLSCVHEFIGESYKIMLLLPFMHTIKGQLKASSSFSSSAEHDSTQAGHISSRLNYVTLFVCFHCLTYKTTFFWPNDLIKSSYVMLFAALVVWRSKWRMTFVLRCVRWSPDTWKGFTAVLYSFRMIISLNKHVKAVKFGCMWLFTASKPLVSIITQNLS